ncbi:MAG: DUF3179 domain-containing protein [Thermoanaerobaculia bacterium]
MARILAVTHRHGAGPRTARGQTPHPRPFFNSLLALLLGLLAAAPAASEALDPERARDLLARLLSEDEARRSTARAGILASNDRSLLAALTDALFFAGPASRPDVVACLEGLSGERLGSRHRYWVEYLGGHDQIRPHEGYRAWKAALFSRIDPSFGKFLDPSRPLTVRPEEIVWGGVKKDGIPALKNPRAVGAHEASFLEDSETVFGVGFGGQYRAYPQRILDWHEMANDTVGRQAFALSYCTLCGAAIAYATRLPDGRTLVFGSSGLLYRSNKLMYDEETWSLWSNLTGEPVGGPLASSGLRLPILPLTVTTWKEWRQKHPETTVVSPDTGYDRDYSAGAAYGRYFASPDTMFPVWKRDAALEPKAWVYGLRNGPSAKAYPLETLFAERVVNDRVGALPVVLVAEPESQSVRAYLRGSRELAEGPAASQLVDPADGAVFRVEEERLAPSAAGASPLPRYAGHRAYWFGWYAFFPDTALYEGCPELVKRKP